MQQVVLPRNMLLGSGARERQATTKGNKEIAALRSRIRDFVGSRTENRRDDIGSVESDQVMLCGLAMKSAGSRWGGRVRQIGEETSARGFPRSGTVAVG